MGVPRAVLIGTVCGVIGAIPGALLFEGVLRWGKKPDMALGVAGVLLSFGTMSCAIAVAYLVDRENVFSFGVSVVATFLAIWTAESVRAWHAANPRDGQGG